MRRKKFLCILALLCAVVQGVKAQANWDEVYAMTQTTSESWTALTEGSATGTTIGEAGTTTYCYADTDLSFTNSNAGGSGLTIEGTVYLYVPQGVTLTCTGADASGQTGAGAGIEVASGNTLYIFGCGTVNATGGNAADGGNGTNGSDASCDYENMEWAWVGGDGHGGHGGGGAGAGIGTRGGEGGAGGSAPAKEVYYTTWTENGVAGSAGSAGQTANAMGTLYVSSTITVNVTGGSQGSAGTAGSAGKSCLRYGGNEYSIPGGGGGGAGGFGGAGSDIGTGGPGGGGGGGGAKGSHDRVSTGFYNIYANGGSGGQNGDGSYAANGGTAGVSTANVNNGTCETNDLSWVQEEERGKESSDVNTTTQGGSGGAAGSASASTNAMVISIVSSETTAMASGIYYVLADVTVTKRITISGNVTLSLGEGTTLHAPKGIELRQDNSLTIDGPGALTIDGCDENKPGIGARVMGALTINGGQLTITGGNGAPGIGADSGTLTLGWNAGTDFIACSSYAVASITFAPGKNFILQGTTTTATPDNMGGKKLVPLIYVTSESTTLTSGEYVLNASVTISTRITIRGDVVLHLGEGATLNAQLGIKLSQGNSLTINGPGALTIDRCIEQRAGIGDWAMGTLTINGGTINVTGGRFAAALGGNAINTVGGSITINGGVVNATGGYLAAGIGGGNDGNKGNYGVCGDITINGGQVTVIGGGKAAGIGPGYEDHDDHYYSSGTLTLGWTNADDFIYISGFKNEQNSTLESITFAPGKMFSIDGTTPVTSPDNIGGMKLMPFLNNQCGDGLTWIMYDNDGNGLFETLNILHDGSGTGAMTDYGEDGAAAAPWDIFSRSDITTVNMADGVTHIGNNAFRSLTGIAELTLPAAVTSIGTGAFAGCSNLSRINMMNGDENLIVSLGEGALQDCNALTTIAVTKPILYKRYAEDGQWSAFSSKLRLALGHDYFFEAGGSRSNAYYQIASADDLRRLAEAVNAGNGAATYQQKFCQTADIDLAGADFPGIGWRGGNESFQGSYDGGEHIISGLNVSSSHDCAGLFGYLSNRATLSNIFLIQPSVTATTDTGNPVSVGAFAGYTAYAGIENCHVLQPTLSATGSGTKHIGAIVGEINEMSNRLTNCFYYHAGDFKGIGNNRGSSSTIDNIVAIYTIGIDDATVELPSNLYVYPQGDYNLRYIKKDLGFTLNGTIYLRDQLQFTPNVKVYNPGISGYATRLMFDGQVLKPDEGATSPTQVTITVCADYDGKTLSAGIRGNEEPLEVTYVDAHGLNHTTQAIPLDGYEPIIKKEGRTLDGIELAAGTYFVGINLDYTGVPFYPKGDLTLILGNGRTMRFGTKSDPTTCPAIAENTYSLTVYGQSLDAATAGTLRCVGQCNDIIRVSNYTQHSGNVILSNSHGNGLLVSRDLTLNGGTLSVTTDTEEAFAINALSKVTINGGQLTANATGTGKCYGLLCQYGNINLGWTRPSDFICASSYEAYGTIATALVPGTDVYRGFTPDDGTTFISGTLDAATLAGRTLRPTWVGQGTTPSDPYLISTPSDLDLLASRVNGHRGQTRRDDGYVGCYFRLTNDIAYPYTTQWDDIASTENNYEPIARYSDNIFRGDFDGGGHTVSGIRLYINATDNLSEAGYLGLFGFAGSEANIHDLIIANANITAHEYVAGIVGYNYGTLTRCHVANNVALRADERGCSYFGGIAGCNQENGIVTHCTSAVNIVVSSRGSVYQLGGIAGDNVYATMTDNIVFGATVPASSWQNSHGAITGRPYQTTLTNNYYSACNVAGIPNATGMGTGPIDSRYVDPCDIPEDDGIVSLLRDQADNTVAIERVAALATALPGDRPLDLGWGPARFPIQLAGRTLYKDGAWNTICLPFSLDSFTGTPLEGATVKTLASTSFSDGTLTMTFSDDLTSITAGKPYIVKWADGTDIENPVFPSVTISDVPAAKVSTDYADFVGTYSPVSIYTAGKTNLYLSADNTLYYPTAEDFQVNAFRGYFQLKGLTAGDPTSPVRAFVLNFGDGNASGIITTYFTNSTNSGNEWYTLDGRKLDAMPTAKGLYINNGKKVIVK